MMNKNKRATLKGYDTRLMLMKKVKLSQKCRAVSRVPALQTGRYLGKPQAIAPTVNP